MIEVCLNGTDWIEVNQHCVHKIYEDSMPMLLIVVDELAELSLKSGLKSLSAKEEDSMKDEIVSIIGSIAQLGRSAEVHVLVCTQKPNASVVPTVLRSNLGLRVFMGTAAEAGASLVTLDSTLATTTDGSHPGMGIAQVNAVPVFFRGYFSKFSDLEEYYRIRGLDEKGFGPNDKQINKNQTLEDEELSINDEKKTFEFEGEKADINNSQEQQWEEV